MTNTRVLVVDDEESIRSFVQQALTLQGYDIVTAADGPEALRVATEQPPFQLFIVDVVMPQMAGDEAGRRLLEMQPGAKVLYFTGYAEKLFEQRHALMDNEAFVEKPVSLNGLMEAVALLLSDGAEAAASNARRTSSR